MTSLISDLVAADRWIEINTYCALQRADGWYVKDCIERKAKRKCDRCRIRARLRRHIESAKVAA